MVLASTIALSGCATAVVGSITVSQLSTAVGIASAATTGKGLQDHALSIVTGQDCRLLEGIFRTNRNICEEPGSPATEDDFPGVVVMLFGEPDDVDAAPGEPEVIYAGLSSTYRPALTRRARQQGAIGAAIEVQTAAYIPEAPTRATPDQPLRPTPISAAVLRASNFAVARPSLRPGHLSDTPDPIVQQAALETPTLIRTTARRTGSTATVQMAANEGETLPALTDWADAQPTPTITTVRLALD